MIPTPPMRSPKSPLRWLLAALLTLILLFTVMALTARERDSATVVEAVLHTALYPFQGAAGWVANRVRATTEELQELFRLREENARLRARVQELQHLESLNQVMAVENRQLREELGLRHQIGYRLLAAEVIVRQPSNWFQSVVINRGLRDGVRSKMAVINSRGMVGYIDKVSYTTATVRLLSDRGFQVPVRTAESGEFGILKGQGTDSAIVEFPYNRDAQVQPGYAIMTSGLGTVVPGNLYLGAVTSVGMQDNNLVKYATVKPGVDFNSLSFVQVVITEPEAAGGVGSP